MINKQFVSRISLAFITILPVILIWGGTEFYLHNHAEQEQNEKIQYGLANIRSRLEQSLYSNLLILNSLAAVVKTNPDINQQQFPKSAY